MRLEKQISKNDATQNQSQVGLAQSKRSPNSKQPIIIALVPTRLTQI